MPYGLRVNPYGLTQDFSAALSGGVALLLEASVTGTILVRNVVFVGGVPVITWLYPVGIFKARASTIQYGSHVEFRNNSGCPDISRYAWNAALSQNHLVCP